MITPRRCACDVPLAALGNKAAEKGMYYMTHGPTIVVKVLKADKVRTNARGDAPDPMVKLRINVGRCPPFLPSEAARACCPDDAQRIRPVRLRALAASLVPGSSRLRRVRG